MADGIQYSLTGVDELVVTLNAVTYDTKRKGGRFALRKAAQAIRDAAKRNAEALDDASTGRQIAANIKERWNGRHFKRTGDPAFRIGVQHGAVIREKGNPDPGMNGPTPHWRLLELGTEKMRAHPFMRPALENNINLATDTFVREFEKSLDRTIKRAAKKGTTA